MKKLFKLNPFGISSIIVTAGIIAYFAGIPFLDLVELKTIDLRFESRGQLTPRPEIVMAVIDEKSIAREGKWVWPRSKMVKLVNKLSQAGARVVSFDIGFLEPDDKRVVQTIDEVKSQTRTFKINTRDMDNYLESLKHRENSDRQLAEAIRNSSSKIVLGYFFQMTEKDAAHISADELKQHEENIKGSQYKIVRYASSEAQHVELYKAAAPQSNIKEIAESSEHAGYFNMVPDRDGVVRWVIGACQFKDTLYAPMSLNAIAAYLDSPLSIRVAEFGVDRIQIGDVDIPTDEYGRILVNYRGTEKTYPHISITDILNDQVPVEQLKDKIVLVGATATGIYDLRVTPFSNVFPGLEIHANLIDNVLSEDYLFKPGWAALFDFMAIFLSGILLWFALPRVGAVLGAVIASALLGGYILLCQFLFSTGGMILNIMYPVSVMVLIYVGITLYKYIVESSQKRFIKNAFSTYLAPSVVKQIIDSPERLVLGGEQRDITAFFSDVQGFTSISEKLTAPELVELLNEFLTEMTDIILKHEGTLDKFEGDAIIAFFGAPNYLENHAQTACLACIDMQKRLTELRTKWKTESKPQLFMRIGLCSGPAVVGNMGSKNRMDYTMMGDTVNTAARLEGVNKVYDIYTLIGETTFRTLDDRVVTREIDSINVIGKKEPVSVYQLIGNTEETDAIMIETIDLYHQGLDAYRHQKWDLATGLFQRALEIVPEDGPCRTMIARCEAYRQNPPGANWDGTFAMVTK